MAHGELTVTDLFCGAGGSSTGIATIPGLRIVRAANHWKLAVETHNANHPNTDHECADISQVDPRRFPRTDLLWGSPECTNHSGAQGRKRVDNQPDMFGETLPDEAAERSRATMWDIVRFTEVHRYEGIVVENVVEAKRWVLFDAWLTAMLALGYQHQIVYLNSMHAQYAGAGAAQSRDRMYVCFWKSGNRVPDLHRLTRPMAICPTCGPVAAMQGWKKPTPWGRYRSQYTYRCPNIACRNTIVEPFVRPAADIIDWTLRGQRIGDRTRPLAGKTMARIQAGIDRYWGPTILEAAGHTYDAANPNHPRHGQPGGYMRVWPADEPMRTVHTTISKALAVPVEGRDGKQAAPVSDPLRTMTTRNETGLVVPSGGTWRETATSTGDPIPTRTTRETDGIALPAQIMAPPFIAELRGGSSDARLASDPLATVTASGNHHGLVTSYYGKGGTTSTDDAMPTVTTVEKHALLMRNNTGGAEMTTPITEPARTITTGGHQSLLATDTPTIDIADVEFRMLEPDEITAAMDFPTGYLMLGTRREKVRLAGNAVTPCAARDIVTVMAEAITGQSHTTDTGA